MAHTQKTLAVFITIHTNPRFELGRNEPERAGFNDFLDTLSAHIKTYRQPIVLAHGDFHYFLVDNPSFLSTSASAYAIANEENEKTATFTRLQTFGATAKHWLKIKADPANREIFSFLPQTVMETDELRPLIIPSVLQRFFSYLTINLKTSVARYKAI